MPIPALVVMLLVLGGLVWGASRSRGFSGQTVFFVALGIAVVVGQIRLRTGRPVRRDQRREHRGQAPATQYADLRPAPPGTRDFWELTASGPPPPSGPDNEHPWELSESSSLSAGPAAPSPPAPEPLTEQDAALVELGWEHLRSGAQALGDAVGSGDPAAVDTASQDLSTLVAQIHEVLPGSDAPEARALGEALREVTDHLIGLPESAPDEQRQHARAIVGAVDA